LWPSRTIGIDDQVDASNRTDRMRDDRPGPRVRPESRPAGPSSRSEAGLVTLLGAALLLVFGLCLASLLPNRHGFLGHDYALFLPQLLAGFFWSHENGYWQVPWGTPAFCGGVPLFPNPQTPYHSLPQVLTLVADPQQAVFLSVLAFAALGYAGFYLLSRRGLGASLPASVTGAALFMFNGFFFYRMVIGHVTFHGYMLVPWIAFLLMEPPPGEGPAWPAQRIARLAAAALLVAYLLFSGMVNGIIPALLAVLALGALHALGRGPLRPFVVGLAVALLWAAAIAAAKLHASLAYLSQFARTDYRLPGFGDLLTQLAVLVRSLFLWPGEVANSAGMVNVHWILERHEFEYGVSLVPLLLILAVPGMAFVRGRAPAGLRWSPGDGGWWPRAVLAGVLVLPLIANLYHPAWNALLKTVPVVQSMSSLVRLYAAYIPVVIALAVLGMDWLVQAGRRRNGVAAACVVAAIAQFVAADDAHYQRQQFDPGPLTRSYAAVARSGAPVPAITSLGDGRYGNDALAVGVSPMNCYEPMFGYRLEHLPGDGLSPGPMLADGRVTSRLRNPACYVFPGENGCVPGDPFPPEATTRAQAFITYGEPGWQFPMTQRLCSAISTVAAALALLALLPLLARRAKS
jgi:hypothetical protein